MRFVESKKSLDYSCKQKSEDLGMMHSFKEESLKSFECSHIIDLGLELNQDICVLRWGDLHSKQLRICF